MMKKPQATRPAFIFDGTDVFKKDYTFDFYAGFALSQIRKNIDSFHESIKSQNNYHILEASRKSENIIGTQLSAFNLLINISGKNYPVECVYQASKVFEKNQFIECLEMKPYDAKKYIQDNSKNMQLTEFNLFGRKFSTYPFSLFYDYLYILALKQNNDLSKRIIDYDCFTDIAFNPKKQLASQARSCALFCYLKKNKLVDDFLLNYNNYMYLYEYL